MGLRRLGVSVSLGCYNKIPQTGWLKQHLFLTVLEAGKFKIKMLADLAYGESPLPCLQMATFWQCPPLAEAGGVLWSLICLLIRSLNPSWDSTLMTSSKPNYLPKAPHLNTITLGIRISTNELQRDTNVQSIALGHKRTGSFGLVHWDIHS